MSRVALLAPLGDRVQAQFKTLKGFGVTVKQFDEHADCQRAWFGWSTC